MVLSENYLKKNDAFKSEYMHSQKNELFGCVWFCQEPRQKRHEKMKKKDQKKYRRKEDTFKMKKKTRKNTL